MIPKTNIETEGIVNSGYFTPSKSKLTEDDEIPPFRDYGYLLVRLCMVDTSEHTLAVTRHKACVDVRLLVDGAA